MATTKKIAKTMHKGRVEWAMNELKDYQIGKNIQNSYTHIFISKKDDELSKVQKLFNQFREKSKKIEFDSLYKVFKLQKYKLTADLFRNSHYSLKTISVFKSIAKRVANNTIKEDQITKFPILYEFLTEVNKIAKPFPLMYDTPVSRKTYDVNELINSGVLNNQEINFIKSEIKTIDNKKEKQKMRKSTKTTVSSKKTKPKFSKQDQEIIYNIIINNYDKGSDYIMKTIKSSTKARINELTVKNYILFCKKLYNGKKITSTVPKMLLELWNKQPSYKRIIESTNATAIVPGMSKDTEHSYILVSDKTIIMMNDNIEYVKGFKDCAQANNIQNNWKLYKIQLVQE